MEIRRKANNEIVIGAYDYHNGDFNGIAIGVKDSSKLLKGIAYFEYVNGQLTLSIDENRAKEFNIQITKENAN